MANLYPMAIRGELGGYFIYIPVTAPGTFSIVPDLAVDPVYKQINGTLNTTNGTLKLDYPYGTLAPTTFTVTGPSVSDISVFSISVLSSLNNVLFFSTLTTPSKDPSYNALPPVTYDYSYNLVANAAPGDSSIGPYSTTLPVGLALDPDTGTFLGTLSFFSLWPLTTYNVNLTNGAHGESWTLVSLAVDTLPIFAYTNSPYIDIPGLFINIVPTIGTSAVGVYYYVSPQSPALPEGLTLNTSTAVISGTPTSNSLSAKTYTIVAQTASGSPSGYYQTTLEIYINLPPHFNYPLSPYVLIQNVYTEIIPSNYVGGGGSSTPVVPPLAYTNQLKKTPPARFYGCAVYIGNYQVIYFGGNQSILPAAPMGVFCPNDVWSYDAQQDSWTQLVGPNQTGSPVGRFIAGCAFDSANSIMYIFGGASANPDGSLNTLNELWAFNVLTLQWSQVITSFGPTKTTAMCMGYDDVHKNILVFGGFDPNTAVVNSSTWIFSIATQQWTLLNPPLAPSARYGASMAYVGASNNFLLFGGTNVSNDYNDLWQFNGTTQNWTMLINLDIVGSPPRSSFNAMTYDLDRNSLILFEKVNTQTWAYAVGNNTWALEVFNTLHPFQSNVPMVYIVDNETSVIFCNVNDSSENQNPVTFVYQKGKFGDYDWAVKPDYMPLYPILGVETTPFQISANNLNNTYAYNAVANTVLLSLWKPAIPPSVGPNNETWEYNCTTLQWRSIPDSIIGDVVTNRQGASMVYVADKNIYILFGGRTSFTSDNKLFTFDGVKWTELTPSVPIPSPRYGAAMVYNPVNSTVLMFGGSGVNDTWALNTTTFVWDKLVPLFNTSPPTRSLAAACFDTTLNVMFLFGGSILPFDAPPDQANLLNDLWAFDYLTNGWTNLFANGNTAGPSARLGAQMVYCSVTNTILLFGGMNYVQQNSLNDTWSFKYAANATVNTWTNLNPSNAPTATNPTLLSPFVFYNAPTNVFEVMYPAPAFIANWQLQPVAPVPTPVVPFDVLYLKCQPENAPRYTTTPSLPYGLKLNPTNGIIYGTPTVLQPPYVYTIIGTNITGYFSTTLIISVVRSYTGSNEVGYCYDEISDYKMRHKATVLQYTQNSSGLTKKQLWAQAVRGNGQFAKRTWGTQSVNYTNPNVNGLDQQGNSLLCPSNPVICLPTYNSDVPGPVLQLCQDTRLPAVQYLSHRQLTLNGTKWPQTQWSPERGGTGFPRGKAGSGGGLGSFFFK
jgi:N-acetylneuraminic acid mutarotase